MRNRICERLGIRYPIVEGGLAYVGNGSLAAAVSNGGGFGMIGSAGRSVVDFSCQIDTASNLTCFPFGVNLPISEHSDPAPYIEVILKKRNQIHAVSISAGNPRPYIPVFKEAGLITLVLTSTVGQALKAEEAGADILVCEGFEAGGHNGPAEMTVMALIPQVTREVQIPVVAAGGISDGRTMLAAIILGAEAVQIGTRFVATWECQAHESYKRLLVESKDNATVVMERSIGRVNRVIKGPYSDQILKLEGRGCTVEEILPYIRGVNNKIAAVEGNLQKGWVNSGQNVGLIDSIESAEEVVRNIAIEAENLAIRIGSMKGFTL